MCVFSASTSQLVNAGDATSHFKTKNNEEMKTIQPTDELYDRCQKAAEAAVNAALEVTGIANELFFAVSMAAGAVILAACKDTPMDPMACVDALAINVRSHIMAKQAETK